jgi:hypothetical protein
MQKKRPEHKQAHLLYPDLLKQLNPKHLLLLLAQNIVRSKFEGTFAKLYYLMGSPVKPMAYGRVIAFAAIRKLK